MIADEIQNLAAMRQTFAKLKKMGILTEYNIGPQGVTYRMAEPEKLRAIFADLGRDFDQDVALYALAVAKARGAI